MSESGFSTVAVKALGRVLLVEDELNLGATLFERLSREGYDLAWAKSVEQAELELAQRKWDLILLDVGLPDG
ncbi:DNA-binding response regulator, partial [bacterium]|nr:DNA-binding response regulator [bacterium]